MRITELFWHMIGLIMFVTCYITFPDLLDLLLNGHSDNYVNVFIFLISGLGFFSIAQLLYGRKKI